MTVPLLVGAGQVTDKPDDPTRGLEPLALMECAARRAADDAGRPGLLGEVDTVAVVTNVFHDYGDTATLLAERLALQPGRRLVTTWGGNTPQALVNHLCDEIVAGRTHVALVAGAEAVATLRALGRRGVEPAWTPHRATDVPRWGALRPGTSDLESAAGAREAFVTFALVENAFRAARGQTLADASAEIGAFAARCTRVAAANPYAWFRDAKDAATLTTVTPENRMVAFPYPKYLNAIMDVNQGAALVLASDTAARRLGVGEERWVFPWAGADVTEQWFLTERTTLHDLPATRHAARGLLEAVERTPDDVTHLDLYSCFPIAPRLAAQAIGIDPAAPRPFTVTGGLPWFGGPGNNYGTHALAAMMTRLRDDRGATGLVHGLGWSCTKHALAVLSGSPSPVGWRRIDTRHIQATIDATPPVTVVGDATGPARVETFSVVHGRGGEPERAVLVTRLPDGRRALATAPPDPPLLRELERDDTVGRSGVLHPGERVSVFHPA